MVDKDIQRLRQEGFAEGPLHYVPHVVLPMGAVYLPEKEKFRLVMDATRAGVNDAQVPLETKYDLLEDVLPLLRPGDKLSKVDMTDAFFHWATRQQDCDLQGIKSQKGEYYRMRYTYFGSVNSPHVQMKWAKVIKVIVNNHGLKYCKEGSAEADYGSFKVLDEESRASGIESTHNMELAGAFVDDFMLRHAKHLTQAQCESQLTSVVKFLEEDLGVHIKHSKTRLPCTLQEYLGLMIDTIEQTVSVSPEKATKYKEALHNFLKDHAKGSKVSRKEFAGIVGKLQFCATVVPRGQEKLTPCYWGRDNFTDPTVRNLTLKQQWHPEVLIRLTSRTISNLTWWKKALGSEDCNRRKIYISHLPTATGFWRGITNLTDSEIDERWFLEDEVDCCTTDASGYAGGAWAGLDRLVYKFPKRLGPEYRSSNYRELYMIYYALKHWGHKWRNRRLLIRSDNSTCVNLINKRRTKSAELHPLYTKLAGVVEKFNVDLACAHIPGVANGLADRLSRAVPTKDTSDWMFRRDEYERLKDLTGGYSIDASADMEGRNAQEPRFWSIADSLFDHCWSGEAAWCNTDFNILLKVLMHFREGYAKRPYHTSGTFIIPGWTDKLFWKKLKGFKVLAVYPEGTHLFTAPPKGLQTRAEKPRRNLGPTRWLTLAVHCPPLPTRMRGGMEENGKGGRGGILQEVEGSTARDKFLGMLPTLSGDGVRDGNLLRSLPVTTLQ